MKSERFYGKEITDCKSRPQTKVRGPCVHSLQALRETPCLFEKIQLVSHLFSRVSLAGADTRCCEE